MKGRSGRLAVAALWFSAAALGVSASAAEHETSQKIVVHLSHYTDDLHAVSMALALSKNLQEGGAVVTIFLDLEGARLAATGGPRELRWGAGSPISEAFDSFVEAGGSVVVCAHCARAAGVDAAELRSGARIGTDAEVRTLFLAVDKVIDF